MSQRSSHLGKAVRKKLLARFVNDLTVAQAATMVNVNRNTVNVWHRSFREQILAHVLKESPKFYDEVELNESYFGGPRKNLHAKDILAAPLGISILSKEPTFIRYNSAIPWPHLPRGGSR